MEKEEILSAIGRMFEQYGIRSVSMDDISRKLGISKKTLYLKFKDKKEIVEQIMRSHIEEMYNLFEKEIPLKEDAIVEILELLKMIRENLNRINPTYEYDLKKYYSDLYKEHLKVKVNGIRNFYTRNYYRGIEEGYYREDFDIDMMVKFNLIFLTNLEGTGFLSKQELYSFDSYRQYFIYHIRGVASKKGIEILNNRLLNYNF